MAKALRNIPLLLGKAYATGDVIPKAVIEKLTPQVLRTLVNNHTLEVEGMQSGEGTGTDAHLKAKTDQHHDRLKKLEAGRVADAKTIATLEARLDALEGKKPAKGATPKAATTKG